MWTYSNWEDEATDAARLAMLRKHIGEVSGRIAADVSHSGGSRSSGTLVQYLDGLRNERARLEAIVGRGPARPLRIRRYGG